MMLVLNIFLRSPMTMDLLGNKNFREDQFFNLQKEHSFAFWYVTRAGAFASDVCTVIPLALEWINAHGHAYLKNES